MQNSERTDKRVLKFCIANEETSGWTEPDSDSAGGYPMCIPMCKFSTLAFLRDIFTYLDNIWTKRTQKQTF